MPSPRDLAVLVPVARSLEPATEAALRALSDRDYQVRLLIGCSQVDFARSILASRAVRDGFAETLWVDSDVVFHPDDVERLRSHGRPLTAGLYPKKGRPEFAAKFWPGTREVTVGEGGGLAEVQFVGMGFVHVRREVYLAVGRDMPACGGGYEPGEEVTPYFLPTVIEDGGRHCYLSEDYSFCHRARLCGYPILADTAVRLGHVQDKYTLTWDDFTPRQQAATMRLSFGGAATEHPRPE